jgi:hypothetical protein
MIHEPDIFCPNSNFKEVIMYIKKLMHNFNLKNSLKLGSECYHNSFQKLVHIVYHNKCLKMNFKTNQKIFYLA